MMPAPSPTLRAASPVWPGRNSKCAISSRSTPTSKCRSRSCWRRSNAPASHSTRPALVDLSARVNADVERLQAEIYATAGETFNIGSPQQLGRILFDKLGLPHGGKNKTGYATGVEVLQGIARDFPVAAQVLEYREVTKLKNTYIDVLPTLIDPRDNRLHTVLNQTTTATGRLSSTNPNLQKHPGAQRTRPSDPARVRRRHARSRAARGRLFADRIALDGASLR